MSNPLHKYLHLHYRVGEYELGLAYLDGKEFTPLDQLSTDKILNMAYHIKLEIHTVTKEEINKVEGDGHLTYLALQHKVLSMEYARRVAEQGVKLIQNATSRGKDCFTLSQQDS